MISVQEHDAGPDEEDSQASGHGARSLPGGLSLEVRSFLVFFIKVLSFVFSFS